MYAHVEVKKDGRWSHFAAPAVDRDYAVFASVSGERLEDVKDELKGRIVRQASVKGIPQDVSDVTAVCYAQDKEGYHVHGEGVLTAGDLVRLQRQLYELGLGLSLEDDVFKTYISDDTIAAHLGWDDARVVFWYEG